MADQVFQGLGLGGDPAAMVLFRPTPCLLQHQVAQFFRGGHVEGVAGRQVIQLRGQLQLGADQDQGAGCLVVALGDFPQQAHLDRVIQVGMKVQQDAQQVVPGGSQEAEDLCGFAVFAGQRVVSGQFQAGQTAAHRPAIETQALADGDAPEQVQDPGLFPGFHQNQRGAGRDQCF